MEANVIQWTFRKLQPIGQWLYEDYLRRQALNKALHPWDPECASPFTCGLPLTTELIFENGYHVWPLHHTALRRQIAVWGSYALVGFGLYVGFSDYGWSFLMRPEELLVNGATSAVFALPWWFLCKKLTPIKITLGKAKFGWWCWKPYNRAFISEYGVEAHPKAMGHKEREREAVNMNDVVLNTYRVFAVYGGRKQKVADVYGMAQAEALRDRLQSIHDFLNTQIDKDIPVDTGR